jgi:hypothetical protein
MFFICFFIFFICFYVFLPTYTPNHTKSLWIEIHSPQLRGSDLMGLRKPGTPQAVPALSMAAQVHTPLWHPTMAANSRCLHYGL